MKQIKKAPNRIREERKNKKMNIDDLAKLIGVSRATINNYETGTHDPKLTTWKALADIFNVDIGYLQGVSDFKKSKEVVKKHDDELAKGLDELIRKNASKSELVDLIVKDFSNKDHTVAFENAEKEAANINLEDEIAALYKMTGRDVSGYYILEEVSKLNFEDRYKMHELISIDTIISVLVLKLNEFNGFKNWDDEKIKEISSAKFDLILKIEELTNINKENNLGMKKLDKIKDNLD
ncbi:transcriptional regulator, Cro/CI family protein [Weissella koreensis KACC 15510]|uniref:helix-turn-helix domain-containing protein n=1 Tax=Weissella koreensis TaxID=165096 RepID=UPI0002175056|nr:helix-turn-helix domain-containing protein [Weissella koreensis]AEJ23949.1 transcriptional regulator, Cro/CI family protein [Weissella koreensis KACC 15510]